MMVSCCCRRRSISQWRAAWACLSRGFCTNSARHRNVPAFLHALSAPVRGGKHAASSSRSPDAKGRRGGLLATSSAICCLCLPLMARTRDAAPRLVGRGCCRQYSSV